MKQLDPKTQKYIKYAEFLEANEKVIKWCETTLNRYISKEKKDIPTEHVEHILDYLVSDKCPIALNKVSYAQAHMKAERWSKELQKKASKITESQEDVKVILDFKDGFKIVQLIGKNAYEREGNLMSHCAGSYYGKDEKVFSLRDKFNNPHCTISQNYNQIRGKGNGDIHPKYVDYIVRFLEYTGMKIRDSEMAHLGYEVVQFGQYCVTPCYRDRYIGKGQEAKYSDTVKIFTDLHTARTYKGNKICLYKGDIKIDEKHFSLGKIQSVGGYLSIYSSATLPNLKSVGGYLSIYSRAKLNGLKNPTTEQLKIIIKGDIIYR